MINPRHTPRIVLWGARSGDIQIGSPEYVRHHQRLAYLRRMRKVSEGFQALARVYEGAFRESAIRAQEAIRQFSQAHRDLERRSTHTLANLRSLTRGKSA